MKIATFCYTKKKLFTWRELKEYLLKYFRIDLSLKKTQIFLKSQLGLSYEKESTRPLNLDHNLTRLKKALFSIKIIEVLRQSMLLVNVDEASLTVMTRRNYSWSKRGFPSNLLNLIIKESISLMSSILSNGISVTGLKYGIINSEAFIEYIINLLKVWKVL